MRAKEVERKCLPMRRPRGTKRESPWLRAFVFIVTKAAHLLSNTGSRGPSILNGLLVRDSKALLTHNDPENGEPKGRQQGGAV